MKRTLLLVAQNYLLVPSCQTRSIPFSLFQNMPKNTMKMYVYLANKITDKLTDILRLFFNIVQLFLQSFPCIFQRFLFKGHLTSCKESNSLNVLERQSVVSTSC